MSQLECAEGSVCRGFTADGVRKAVTVATEYGGREKGEEAEGNRQLEPPTWL